MEWLGGSQYLPSNCQCNFFLEHDSKYDKRVGSLLTNIVAHTLRKYAVMLPVFSTMCIVTYISCTRYIVLNVLNIITKIVWNFKLHLQRNIHYVNNLTVIALFFKWNTTNAIHIHFTRRLNDMVPFVESYAIFHQFDYSVLRTKFISP